MLDPDPLLPYCPTFECIFEHFFQDEWLKDQHGVTLNVGRDETSVYVYSEKRTVTFKNEYIQLVAPHKKCRVGFVVPQIYFVVT